MSLTQVWQGILDRLAIVERALPRSGVPIITWATVHSVSPLRVRTDDAAVLDVPTDTLAGGLVVGTRVRVELYGTTGRRVLILGTAGGGYPSDHPWTSVTTLAGASYGSGWSAYTTAPWTGVQVRIHLGVLYVTGAISRAGTAGTTLVTLPATHRPAVPIHGVISTQGAGLSAKVVLAPGGQISSDYFTASGTHTLALSGPL